MNCFRTYALAVRHLRESYSARSLGIVFVSQYSIEISLESDILYQCLALGYM